MSSSFAPSTRNEIPGMARLTNVSDELRSDAVLLCQELESGNILYFPQAPFSLSEDDLKFLLASKQTGAAYHKNIAYRPAADRITGLDKSAGKHAERLRGIMQAYSQHAERFLAALLPPYAGKWKLDFASYRPLEERGRPARLRARNDLPHVDAFPTRPTNGDRILRLFSNINPQQNRVWITAPNFAAIAPQFVRKIGLPRASRANLLTRAFRGFAQVLRFPGAARSPYDEFMHRCHNAMKEDAAFQESCPKQRWEFPPHSTWIVFTDCVSHAVLEGQYALEQTFIISQEAMVRPEKSPLRILEGLAGRKLTNPN
jgi:3-deoxy-D-manno-oct-2-ulosonic acid (Kdo) hydroxylase